MDKCYMNNRFNGVVLEKRGEFYMVYIKVINPQNLEMTKLTNAKFDDYEHANVFFGTCVDTMKMEEDE